MPKMECTCGFVFNLSSTSEAEHRLVPERTIENLLGARPTPEEVVDALDAEGVHALLCPKCKRLWLQESQASNRYREYRMTEKGVVPEEPHTS